MDRSEKVATGSRGKSPSGRGTRGRGESLSGRGSGGRGKSPSGRGTRGRGESPSERGRGESPTIFNKKESHKVFVGEPVNLPIEDAFEYLTSHRKKGHIFGFSSSEKITHLARHIISLPRNKGKLHFVCHKSK